jgi:hypothetical protein
MSVEAWLSPHFLANRHNPALGNKLEQRRSHWGHHIDLWTLFQISGAGDGTEDKSALLVQF